MNQVSHTFPVLLIGIGILAVSKFMWNLCFFFHRYSLWNRYFCLFSTKQKLSFFQILLSAFGHTVLICIFPDQCIFSVDLVSSAPSKQRLVKVL